jgi:hypothetical protein
MQEIRNTSNFFCRNRLGESTLGKTGKRWGNGVRMNHTKIFSGNVRSCSLKDFRVSVVDEILLSENYLLVYTTTDLRFIQIIDCLQ